MLPRFKWNVLLGAAFIRQALVVDESYVVSSGAVFAAFCTPPTRWVFVITLQVPHAAIAAIEVSTVQRLHGASFIPDCTFFNIRHLRRLR